MLVNRTMPLLSTSVVAGGSAVSNTVDVKLDLMNGRNEDQVGMCRLRINWQRR